MVAFEAAVAGGIPIIKALREGLTANRIEWIAGIINGTTNFILSEMRDKGLDFAVVLKEAQRLGYAEADPTFDIEGVDAAHKATIMSAIAFGMPVQFDKALRRGHHQAAAQPTSRYAEQLGYRIKLLGITKRTRRKGIELRVHPTLVPAQAPDRQRRRRDERGAWCRATPSARRCTTARAPAPSRPPRAVIADLVDITRLHTADPDAPRAAPGLPAGRDERRRRILPIERGRHLATTCACAWPTRPACSRASPAMLADGRHLDRRACCSAEASA